jgi:hypothetical protein
MCLRDKMSLKKVCRDKSSSGKDWVDLTQHEVKLFYFKYEMNKKSSLIKRSFGFYNLNF